MTPCPRSSEFGTFDGDDVPGFVVRRFRSAAASIGSYAARPSRTDSTCPPVNRLGCYALDYVVSRMGKR